MIRTNTKNKITSKKGRIAAFGAFFSAAALLLCACGADGVPGSGTDAATDPAVQTTEAVTEKVPETAAQTEAQTEPQTEAQTAAQTFAPETEAPTEGEQTVLEVHWQLGYVGSDQNAQNYVNKIKPDGGAYSYSDVITVAKAGTEITFTDDNTNSNGDTNFASAAAYVISSWKEENGKWVIDLDGANYRGSGSADSDIAAKQGSRMVYTYVTGKDNEHIRLCFRSGETAAFHPSAYPEVLIRETSKPGTFSGITAELELMKAFVAASQPRYAALEGKTMYVLGDSYFAGNGLDGRLVWPAMLAEKYGMTFENYGINGSTLSACPDASNPMINRYVSMKSASPDIIIVEGGKNDYNHNAALGTVDSKDSATFMGALNNLLDGLKKKYPDAVILCVTVWNVNQTNSIGLRVPDYATAMASVCEKRGIPCFMACDPSLSLVDMTSSVFRSQFCMTPNDISHLNAAGHRLVMPVFEKFIADNIKETLNKSTHTSETADFP